MLLFIFNNVLLGVGLAMDAFSVSLANGLSEPHMKKRRAILIALTYAFFQALMPLAGWFLVSVAVDTFATLEKFIPWISLALLGYIGIDMIKEANCCFDNLEIQDNELSYGELFMQGVATSIDALSVGLTLADYDFKMALLAAGIISFVTFIICYCGVHIGKKASSLLSSKAQKTGGLILILIGLEIFIKGVFF